MYCIWNLPHVVTIGNILHCTHGNICEHNFSVALRVWTFGHCHESLIFAPFLDFKAWENYLFGFSLWRRWLRFVEADLVLIIYFSFEFSFVSPLISLLMIVVLYVLYLNHWWYLYVTNKMNFLQTQGQETKATTDQGPQQPNKYIRQKSKFLRVLLTWLA